MLDCAVPSPDDEAQWPSEDIHRPPVPSQCDPFRRGLCHKPDKQAVDRVLLELADCPGAEYWPMAALHWAHRVQASIDLDPVVVMAVVAALHSLE